MPRKALFSSRSPFLLGLNVFALVLAVLPNSAFSAPKIVAGTACKTFNAKVTVNNKTYTCIKSGKKLVWNKGVAVKTAAPVTTPSPTPSPTPILTLTPIKIDDLSRDSRISNVSLLSNVSTCKTVDNTPDYSRQGKIHRNGFPRAKENIYPSGKAKILVIPFKYQDLPFTTTVPKNVYRTASDIDMLRNVNKVVENLVKKLSFGRFELEISVLPENEWWTMDPELSFTYVPMTSNFDVVKKMIQKNDGKVDFEKYDSYVFVTTMFSPIVSVAEAVFSTDLKTSKGQANKMVAMTTGWSSEFLYFHELGHSLFGLEDLYIQSEVPSDWLPSELKVIMSWDLMANSSLEVLTNWNRLLMGWITDSEIRCLTDQESSFHYLSGIGTSDQPKLLLINLAPGVTLAAEARYSGPSQGLFLYLIDTNLAHGQGPLRSLTSLLKAGDSKELFDWKFDVLETSKEGVLVKVSKGSGKEYVAPPRNTNQSQSQGIDDKPRPRMGEIVPTGYLQARATWEVSNYKSYRIFITPFDDPKRILFDTGIVNDSRDPLVVEVSGLICGKEFMTTSQFWTERDGKGGTNQSSSGQLRKFECK